ncbi:MAG: diacylglycerol kinase [Opitutaceae bacterium]
MTNDPKDPSFYKNTGIMRVFKSFNYSMQGIFATLKYEAAFRQEAIFAAFLVPASFFLNVPLAQHLLLVGSILLVLIVELLNSAIEAVVDDISLRNRPLAKRAKDAGSAAVLISLLNCFICWASVIVVNWSHWFG